MNIKRREVPFIFSWIVYCNIREEALCSYEGPVFIDSGTYCRFTQKWILGALRCEKHLLMFHSPQCKAGIFLIYSPMSGVTWCSEQWRKCCLSLYFLSSCLLTFHPEQVHEPNFRSHNWSSKGNQVMSILQVLLNIPGGTYRQLPSLDTTTLVWQVPSNFSSALKYLKVTPIKPDNLPCSRPVVHQQIWRPYEPWMYSNAINASIL